MHNDSKTQYDKSRVNDVSDKSDVIKYNLNNFRWEYTNKFLRRSKYTAAFAQLMNLSIITKS